MIRELAHFLRYVPTVVRDRRRLGRLDAFDLFEVRMDEAGRARWRRALVVDLEGDVLEVGAGTGMMFPYYPKSVRLTATEPDEDYLSRARERAEEADATISLEAGTAEDCRFPDASFDAVVSANVLCSVRSVEQTLAEMGRVLRPGGRFRLLEHGRSPHRVSALLMDVVNPLWLKVNGVGCNLNRDPVASLQAAGFTIEGVERFQVFAPGAPTAFPTQFIRARRPRAR